MCNQQLNSHAVEFALFENISERSTLAISFVILSLHNLQHID